MTSGACAKAGIKTKHAKLHATAPCGDMLKLLETYCENGYALPNCLMKSRNVQCGVVTPHGQGNLTGAKYAYEACVTDCKDKSRDVQWQGKLAVMSSACKTCCRQG